MLSPPEIFTSGDGSHSLISPIFDTSYHSKHGAITESMVVFIDAGLNHIATKNQKTIHVFEMGFGTGLNALLTYQWATKNQVNIIYHTVEAYPISMDIIDGLNYGDLCQEPVIFRDIHLAPWDKTHNISDTFSIHKYHHKIEDINPPAIFDVIFYDAFGPSTQSALWEEPILTKMYQILKPEGVLVSFCAQGAFKRHLKAAGFIVERLPGPPGKREMTRATKT